MDRIIQRYLNDRTFFQEWPLHGEAGGAVRSLIVIPCLSEHPGILDTLQDLAEADQAHATSVILVVNNRSDVVPEERHANTLTLKALTRWDQTTLRVAWVDASSSGNELPARQGVGMARKLGLDWGLRLLAEHGNLDVPLVCLDGDTRVDDNYLRAIHAFFDTPNRWSAVLPCAHQISGTRQERAAILCYEFFLRYHADHLAWAGSPYGYHVLGSAIACTARAYAAVSGMNRRLAGEDFHFLQQLRKTGPVQLLSGTTVHPSGRTSHRTPFGTGRRVERFIHNPEDEYTLYAPASYDAVRRWIDTIATDPKLPGETLLRTAQHIHPEVYRFLDEAGFSQVWDGLLKQTSHVDTLVNQFHQWFDGLRTLQLIHHLRDTTWPNENMFNAIKIFMDRCGLDSVVEVNDDLREDLNAQEKLLQQLRVHSFQSNGETTLKSGDETAGLRPPLD